MNLTPGLIASLNGYNGVTKGKAAPNPTAFFEQYILRMARKSGGVHRVYLSEALLKKDEVMRHIAKLYATRNGIHIPHSPKATQLPKAKPTKVLIPHGDISALVGENVDVYYIDGGTLNNGSPNQISRIAVVKNNDLFHEENIGNKTNNEAEYLALITALKDIQGKAIIYSDSQLIVKTFLGEWQTKEPRLITLRNEARALMTESIAIEWKPREYNLAGYYLEEVYNI